MASQPGQEVAESHGPAAGSRLVAVDRLAQQGHFQAALVDQLADLGHDLFRRPALLGTADAGDDAVGAELVAAEHDPHHGLKRRKGRAAGGPLGIVAGETLPDLDPLAGLAVEAHLDLRPAAGGDPLQQGRQLGQLARPDHQVHVRRPLEDLLLVLLGHAADDADHLVRPELFDVLQPAQGTVDLVLGVLPDAARVEEDRVGLAEGVGRLVARGQQGGGDQLAIQHVHLAADRFDIEAASHAFSIPASCGLAAPRAGL